MTSLIHVVGLTGGIATGKSTVGRMIRDAGIPVMDADSFGHMVLEPGGLAYDQVVQEFGTEILAVDNRSIDRQKLGKKVFDDPNKRLKLESITHPAIGQLAKQGMELVSNRGETLVVYEAALLVETGIYKNMDALIVVTCSLENQIRRVCARDGISREAAATRIASQLPSSEKIAVANYVLENDGIEADLENGVLSTVEELKKQYTH